MNNRYLLGIAAFLIFAWGGEVGGNAFSGVYGWLQNDLANAAPGVVTKSERVWASGKNGGRFQWDIEYTYYVEGEKLIGDRVLPSNYGIDVDEVLSSYPVGQRVTVWYSESDRKNAMLEPIKISFMAFFIVVVSVLLPALISLVWLRPSV